MTEGGNLLVAASKLQNKERLTADKMQILLCFTADKLQRGKNIPATAVPMWSRVVGMNCCWATARRGGVSMSGQFARRGYSSQKLPSESEKPSYLQTKKAL